MGRFLKVIGVLSLIVIGCFTVAISLLFVKSSALNRESRVYVDTAIPAIASTWDKQQLMSRASPELVEQAGVVQLDIVFARFGQLGSIVSFEQPKGQASAFYSTGTSREVASYVTNAIFQNGTARLRMDLSKQDGRWMIAGFFLDAIKLTQASHA